MKKAFELIAQYVSEDAFCGPTRDEALAAVEALRSYADALPDKPLPPDGFWQAAHNGPISDKTLALYQLERPGKRLPPKHPAIVLTNNDHSAVFVAIERGKFVQCVFRNESGYLSSDLIRQAMDAVWFTWPGRPLFTLVDPAKTRARVPGFVFRMAGWRFVGMTNTGVKLGANQKWFVPKDGAL